MKTYLDILALLTALLLALCSGNVPAVTPTGNQIQAAEMAGYLFGPVAFFAPFFWSQATLENPEWAGLMLDLRPVGPNKAIQLETQRVPAILSTNAVGRVYARVAPTSFPINHEGNSIVLHRITAYKKAALWDDVQRWFDGSAPSTGLIKAEASAVHTFRQGGGSSWSVYGPNTPREEKAPLPWKSFATSFTPNPVTFGYRWDDQLTRRNGALVTLPEYYRLDTDGKRPRWSVVSAKEVLPELGLTQYRFESPKEKPQEPRATPDDPESCWKKPGPAAGPFQARLGDGSVVTYFWYRVAEQPAMLNADLTPEEREGVQKRVETLHRAWTKDRNYHAPAEVGTLASLDPALILTPPRGLEAGYVPIAARQELKAQH